MEVAEVDIVANTKNAQKEVGGLEKQFEILSNTILENQKKTQDSLDKVTKTAEETQNSIKKIGGAISKAGIGLVLIAFTQLKAVFSENQKIVDLLATAFETVALVLNDFVEKIVDLLESTAESSSNFDALGKVLINVLKLAITPFKLAFYGIKLAVQEAQLIWEQSVFGSGDTETIDALNLAIAETRNSLIEVKDDMIESAIAIKDNIGEAIEEVGKIASAVIQAATEVNIKQAYETAKANIALQKAAALAEVEGQRLLEFYDLQAETLRQVRDEERNTIAERKEANDKLLLTLNKQNEEMLRQATIIRDSAKAQYNKNKTDENKIALLQAETEIIAVQATVKGFLSEQKSQDLALDRESQELTQSNIDAEAERNTAQRTFLAERTLGEYTRILAMKEATIIEAEEETKRLETKRALYKEGTQAYADASNELLAYQEETSQKLVELDGLSAAAKVDIAKGTLNSLANIFGKESKAGKAAAIAATTIDTLQSSVSAFKSLSGIPVVGPALGGIAAASALMTGFRTIKEIKGTKLPKINGIGGDSGGGGSASGASYNIPSVPAAFNIVGMSGTNQIADVFASQNQAPVKAYVVANDVTTAQSLQRNIVKGASV